MSGEEVVVVGGAPPTEEENVLFLSLSLSLTLCWCLPVTRLSLFRYRLMNGRHWGSRQWP